MFRWVPTATILIDFVTIKAVLTMLQEAKLYASEISFAAATHQKISKGSRKGLDQKLQRVLFTQFNGDCVDQTAVFMSAKVCCMLLVILLAISRIRLNALSCDQFVFRVIV